MKRTVRNTVIAIAVAATSTIPSVAQQPLQVVEQLIRSGQLGAAEKALRALPQRTTHADYLLGFTLIELYRFAEAEEILRQVVATEPENHGALQALAKALLDQGKNVAALEVLDRAIAIDPQPDYRFAKAMCALNTGDLHTAEKELRLCLRDNASHTEALYKLGKLLADRGDYAASIEPLDTCLKIQPNHLEARFLRGLAARHTGDLTTAVAAFEAVIAAVPGHVGALFNLGQVLIRQGRQEEGLAKLEAFRAMSELRDRIDFTERAVKKNPKNVPGRLELGRLLLEAGRTEDALGELMKARQLNPRAPQAYRLLATAFRRLGKADDAGKAEAFATRLEGGS